MNTQTSIQTNTKTVEKLTGYEIQIDFTNNSIVVLRPPTYPDSDTERVVYLIIKAANRAELDRLIRGFEAGEDVTFSAEVTLG